MSSTHLAPILFLTTTHPNWGQGHARRILHIARDLTNDFSPNSWRVEVIDVVLEKKYEPLSNLLESSILPDTYPHNMEMGWPSPPTQIRSWSSFQDWLQGKTFSLVIIDRREPPPVVIDFLSDLGGKSSQGDIPIVAFDIRADLPESPKKIRKKYRSSLGKITYVINPLPSPEETWANLNGWDYLLLPTLPPSKGPKDSRESREVTSKKYIGHQNNITVKKHQKSWLLYLSGFSDTHYIIEAITQIKSYIIAKTQNHSDQDIRPPTLTVIAMECHHSRVKNTLDKILAPPPRDHRGDSKKIDYRLLPFNPEGIDWDSTHTLFTHFGLLGIEAMQRGITTFFLTPTPYHRELTEHYFPDRFLSQTDHSREINLPRKSLNPLKSIGQGRQRLLFILNRLAESSLTHQSTSSPKHSKRESHNRCDLCSATLSIKHRRSWMNLSQCSSCGSYQLQSFIVSKPSNQEIHMWKAPVKNYDRDYFIGEYEKSYGRSYREDEKPIKSLAQKRMTMIDRLWKRKHHISGHLLDIGCAYGFFLDVAKDFGYQTYGVDISQHAGEQVQGHHFVLGDFREEAILKSLLGKEGKPFDIITLWYVIEHFPNIRTVIERLVTLQAPGGILALSTPNARGLSACHLQDSFLKASPEDHFYIFSIEGLKKLLSQFGYEYAGFRSGGIHLHRFREACPQLSWIPGSIYRHWATRTNFGDTMEVYFIKS